MGISSIYNKIPSLGKMGQSVKKAGADFKRAYNELDEYEQQSVVIGATGLGSIGVSTALNMNNPLNLRK
jgi:hypothetical protein